MSAFLKLWNERNRIVQAICESCREAEKWREKEFLAAIKLQSWFRGCRVRAYLKYLNGCAIKIQKTYRGYHGKKVYRKRLKEHLDDRRRNYYDRMAAKIQCTWKGYYTRKYIFNYYGQKEYLNALKEKNEFVRSHLEEYRQSMIRKQAKRDEELYKLKAKNEARKYHYMLSTESSSGVFVSHNIPLPIEEKMRCIKFYTPGNNNLERRQQQKLSDAQNLAQSWSGDHVQLPQIDLSATSGDCRLRHSLPPLNKPQGPFQQPKDIWQKRHQVLNPTLRVATSIECVQKARKQLKEKEEQKIIINEKFLPFSKSSFPYQPMLLSQSSYTQIDYGNKHFRDESPEKHISQQAFKTLVPPIPLFDKLHV